MTETREPWVRSTREGDDRRIVKVSRAPSATNGATLTPAVNEDDVDKLDILIVRVPRRTYWFNGPIAELPKREPYISPTLLSLTVEDE